MKTFDISEQEVIKAKEIANKITKLGTKGIRLLNPNSTGTQRDYLRVRAIKIERRFDNKSSVAQTYRKIINYLNVNNITLD